ncbi:hypothetical protein SteCoe_19599 [Stentor coeruleus]|uniref:Uncharacterized protein n=1 Tax=Stentor coeruleus TaxID=5963 RepID=A0A1R2BTW1_9CILI|nr:hypothetical protein SteCoe_19599 [Stentor coeruleus]
MSITNIFDTETLLQEYLSFQTEAKAYEDALEKELNEKNLQISALEDKLINLRAEYFSYKLKHQNSENAIIELHKSISRLEEKLKAEENIRKALESENEHLDKKNRSLQFQIDDLEGKLYESQEKNILLKEDLDFVYADKSMEIQRLRSKTPDTQISKTTVQGCSCMENNSKLLCLISKYKKEISDLKKQITASELENLKANNKMRQKEKFLESEIEKIKRYTCTLDILIKQSTRPIKKNSISKRTPILRDKSPLLRAPSSTKSNIKKPQKSSTIFSSLDIENQKIINKKPM